MLRKAVPFLLYRLFCEFNMLVNLIMLSHIKRSQQRPDNEYRRRNQLHDVYRRPVFYKNYAEHGVKRGRYNLQRNMHIRFLVRIQQKLICRAEKILSKGAYGYYSHKRSRKPRVMLPVYYCWEHKHQYRYIYKKNYRYAPKEALRRNNYPADLVIVFFSKRSIKVRLYHGTYAHLHKRY